MHYPDIASPQAYANLDQVLADYAWYRREAPVAWIEQEPFRPFWAVTKHADIVEVERQNSLFINAPRLNLVPRAVEDATVAAQGSRTKAVRTLLDMDEPDHRAYRNVTQSWFLGPGVARFQGRVDAICARWLDTMRDQGGRCDFARDIANYIPLYVITSILGIPEEDTPFILRTTQAIFGAADAELQVHDSDFGVTAFLQLFDYLGKLVADRRANPTDDLGSVIANGMVDGAPMAMLETLSYLLIAATAGHETTSAAIAGGLLALIQNPEQMTRLRADPDKLNTDEIVRWVSPIRHMMRTATADYVLRGQTIKAGDSLALFYLSANRDADAFENPDRFDLDRAAGRQLGFGIGNHFCLGRLLAVAEIKTFFKQFVARVESIELDGEIAWMEANIASGLKRMPVRYVMR